jgi:hypothetical protein
VVLFYDGVNDVIYPIYNGNHTGYRVGDDSEGGVRKLSGTQGWLYPLCLRMKEYSCAAELLFHRMDEPRPAHLVDDDTLTRNLDAAETGYRDALVQARTDAGARGARFVHVLQPHLFTLKRLSTYERALVDNESKILPGMDQAFRLGYPRLRQGIATAAGAGVRTHDLTDALDERTGGEEYYLDFYHVNHSANERVARALCAVLRAPGGIE